ncbi:VOC family protein [Geodermatophilus ruber]|uniref:Glyoxalase/fosfomycin resistance/dioxygenase domain-containing protein n=1 Tax=Geodermatophilus ruber TaxID=504800 RepID=A0A1I4LKL4_9ACTN|nr:VOC family protein [Geodermatophilus ruber]SFL91525.1 hypothetical protein SAMN04488085_12237 [Geodermatophilus ruber]
MITGFHTIVYSDDPAVLPRRAAVAVAGRRRGWLIFKTPPGELGVHPTAEEPGERSASVPFHQASLMCDDIEATVADLRARGVEVRDEVQDQGFGLVTSVRVPGAGWLLLYQPRHGLAYELEG